MPDLYREHRISSASVYKWRAKSGGMDASLIKRMKELEDENRRLKRCMPRSGSKLKLQGRHRKKVVKPAQAHRVIRSLQQIIEWRDKPQAL